MKKKDVMLASWLFDESHMGANISATIMSRIQAWEIEEVVCVVQDNDANMVSGLNIANLTSLPCLALEISGKHSSALVIFPIINTLKRIISQDDDDHGTVRGMLKSISNRYKDIELQPLCILATVFDPKFKFNLFYTASSATNARMMLIKECEEYPLKLSSASPRDKPQPK